MTEYALIAIIARAVNCVTCLAVLMLMLLQLRHDVKSRSFAFLVFIIFGNGAMALIFRLIGLRSGFLLDLIFRIVVAFFVAFPIALSLFVFEYLDVWTPARRRLVYGLFGWYAVTIIVAGLGLNQGPVTILESGVLHYEVNMAGKALMIPGALVHIHLLIMITRQLRKSDIKGERSLLLGVAIIVLGSFFILVPSIAQYTIEQMIFPIGVVLIARVILQYRLFDPLAQLNAQLEAQTLQMKHVNTLLKSLVNVATQITGELTTSGLLETTSNAIQREFGYHSVDVRNRAPHFNGAIVEQGAIELPIKLKDGALTGSMKIQTGQNVFPSDQEVEILQILAQHIAITLNNADLYDLAETQRRKADASSEAKSKFLSTMSHELRTPLQTLNLACSRARNAAELGQPVMEALHKHLLTIATSANDLDELIDNVLDFSKIEAGKLELFPRVFDPITEIRMVQASIKEILSPEVQLIDQLPSPMPCIYADIRFFKQILRNLLSNAAKFTDHGSITIAAMVNTHDVKFSISDTGRGIAPNDLAKLISPFQQAPSSLQDAKHGSGLGLALSNQFVIENGGTLTLESELGRGTTCTFTLPRPTSAQSRQAGSEENQRDHKRYSAFDENDATVGKLYSVLVFDAIYKEWDRLRAALAAQGFKPLCAETLPDAEEIASNLDPRYIVAVQKADCIDEATYTTLRKSAPTYADEFIAVEVSDEEDYVALVVQKLISIPIAK